MAMQVVIDRGKWLHGEGSDDSYLLRDEDQKMCCLGFHAEACGVPRERLLQETTPLCIDDRPESMNWLIKANGAANSAATNELMRLNDGKRIKNREKRISAIFRKHGVRIRFVGKATSGDGDGG